MTEINKTENILEENNNKESKEEELLSESDTDDIQLEANGDLEYAKAIGGLV